MDDKIRATILGAAVSVLAVGHLIMEYYKLRGRISDHIPRQPYIDRAYLRDMYMNSLLCRGDIHCIDQIRMRPVAFYELCNILTRYNLVHQSKNMSIKEQVLLFVHCLGHNVRFRVLAGRFHRSSETCHLYFRIVLKAVLKLYKYVVRFLLNDMFLYTSTSSKSGRTRKPVDLQYDDKFSDHPVCLVGLF
ncbi:hypothetical protein CFOL_v3_02753 [Cephalotus follicularis]|uniref:DUF8040 domain-containing protein n=1 Tax=Cephalotus follicularis TaxID=3775 RepID=A0A1Q3AUG7_CEPFO|nr:hypothetical protein CFOL_v3_02753 [Cephalotus follicularis]